MAEKSRELPIENRSTADPRLTFAITHTTAANRTHRDAFCTHYKTLGAGVCARDCLAHRCCCKGIDHSHDHEHVAVIHIYILSDSRFRQPAHAKRRAAAEKPVLHGSCAQQSALGGNTNTQPTPAHMRTRSCPPPHSQTDTCPGRGPCPAADAWHESTELSEASV
ncbi:hypothetical protein SEPCBS57363_005624 [Sporothrix epigloea]|uniref:Uncharacterized protein n=1 Tax=Sporothrix epigloea TaxID=1892477 RepID=A0ABP0DYK8_9PEZI